MKILKILVALVLAILVAITYSQYLKNIEKIEKDFKKIQKTINQPGEYRRADDVTEDLLKLKRLNKGLEGFYKNSKVVQLQKKIRITMNHDFDTLLSLINQEKREDLRRSRKVIEVGNYLYPWFELNQVKLPVP
jgi:hypothetical protein